LTKVVYVRTFPAKESMMFSIVYATGVADDLRRMRGRDRAFVLDRIEAALVDQPTTMTRNRKLLVGIQPPWDQRVGEYRVFYDVETEFRVVTIQAIRHKPPHLTTEEIL
jgi:mRNA-degrading endonuclease RelE of RelBE toxin-antitoxin system